MKALFIIILLTFLLAGGWAGFLPMLKAQQLLQIELLARSDGLDKVLFRFYILGRECEARGDFDGAIRRAVRLWRDAEACRFEPASRPGGHHPAGNIGTVFAGGIFDGGKFFTSYRLKCHGIRSERQGVKYECFELYAVRL